MAPVQRILLLITDLKIGGTPTVVRELAIRLREPGRMEIEVACLSSWGPVADQLRDAGVKVTVLSATSAIDLPRTLWRLVRLIRGEGIDTVFSFLIHANTMAALASAFCPDVRFLQSVQTSQPEPRWHWRLQRLVHPAAERVVVPSASAMTAANKWAGVPIEKLIVIHNAVDVEAFSAIYAANAAREAHVPLRIGFIGRLDPIKRVRDLVGTMPRLPDCRLDIYGEGPERPGIEADIQQLNLGHRVTLHGAVRRPHDALASMDVLVLPSRAEGFGLVLIEAMAAGVPVIGTDVPGIRDVIRPTTGILMTHLASDALIQAVTAASTTLRPTLIVSARDDVEKRFSWPNVLGDYVKLLESDWRLQSRQESSIFAKDKSQR